MAVDFRFIIIGRGMMGAAVARHLSSMADGIALIGPREPEERKTHESGRNPVPTFCLTVRTVADPGSLPRLLEVFAKRGMPRNCRC